MPHSWMNSCEEHLVFLCFKTAATAIKGEGIIPRLIIDATPHVLSISGINIVVMLSSDLQSKTQIYIFCVWFPVQFSKKVFL